MRFPFRQVGDPDTQRNFEYLEQSGIYWGVGAPTFKPADSGAVYYFNRVLPPVANQRVYVWTGSAWTGIL